VADSLNILESALAFPLQCNQVLWEIAQADIPPQCFLAENIVVSGMGGSALGGRIISSLERQILKIPIVVSTEYHLPNFVGPKTLVIISSYSGDTEETIHSLAEAQARDAQIFILASGGKLAQIAKDQNLPHFIFSPRHNPSNQPRMGLGYNIMTIISLLSRCQLIHPISQLSSLKQYLQDLTSDVKPYQDIALQLKNKIPVLVASEHLKGAAHAFKNQLNETAKSFACLFDIPELNHHLMEGLMFPKANPGSLHFLMINSSHYHPEVKRRYILTSEVISKNHIPVSIIPIHSPNRLFDALNLVQMGALVSFYLSQTYDIDPGPVPWVDYFKDALKPV
jgi:glucose/mannose-6-phosphate isomerase